MIRKLSILAFSAACALISAQANAAVSVDLSIDPIATKTTDRILLTMTGTYNCSLGNETPSYSSTALRGSIHRAVGRTVERVNVNFPTGGDLICDGTDHVYTATAIATSSPWSGGKAHVFAEFEITDCGLYTCERKLLNVDQSIRISGGND